MIKSDHYTVPLDIVFLIQYYYRYLGFLGITGQQQLRQNAVIYSNLVLLLCSRKLWKRILFRVLFGLTTVI